MKNSANKIEKVIGELYWKAHTDGRLVGKKGKTNFGLASVTIEIAINKLLTSDQQKKRVKRLTKENYELHRN